MNDLGMLWLAYRREIITSIVLLIVVWIARMLLMKAFKKLSTDGHVLEQRGNLVIRHLNIFLGFLTIVGLIIIWGVEARMIVTTLSAVITVVGVALFAQWSILSNITSGIVLLYSFPFKIGDVIKIHDKDFPIEAEIEDIRTFHVLLRTQEGEVITYPNNLIMQKSISIVKVFSSDGYGE